MRDLQTIKFNSENFESFLANKFYKIIEKINNCGLEKLEDNYLNLYLLACLDRSKRIIDVKEFYDKLGYSFLEFLTEVKEKILPNSTQNLELQDHYSDISNESFEENLQEEIVNSNNNSLDDFEESKNSSNDYSKLKNENQDLETTNITSTRPIEKAFPHLLSPIKSNFQLDQSSNQLDLEDGEIYPETSNAVYEDLNTPQISDKTLQRSPFFTIRKETNIELDKKIESNNLEQNLLITENRTLNDNHKLINENQEQDTNISEKEKDFLSSELFFIDKNGSI